jgi:UDP-N-acetylglucosamine acyltransferase
MSSTIHPTSIISEKAKIGENVSIGPFCHIEDDVIIGDNVEVHSHVSLLNGTRLGNDVKIHQGTVIAGVPQDLKFGGEITTAEIGDRSVVREFCTINRGTTYHNKTVVGKDCLIMAYVHLAHDVIVGDKVILANSVQVAGHVEIGYHVTIGGLVPVHQFVKIGDHSFIGGGLRVPKDVPPYCLAMGEPLVYGGLNKIGLQRRGFSAESIDQIKKAYRIFYSPNLLKKEAIEKIKYTFDRSDEINVLIHFFEKSDRGIIGVGRK